MKYLNILDYSIIAAYFAILIAIGLYLKKRAASSIEAYFLGGRKMPWWALGIASNAAWFDMTGSMVITSFLFLLGPRGLYIEFRGGACLVLAFLLLWAGKWHRRSGVITSAEWMIYRFGQGCWGNMARVAQVVSMVLFGIGILAYSFKGAGMFLSMFMPFSPLTCMAILIIITTIYTLEGGFYGVIVTDVFQTLCKFAGVGVIIYQAMGASKGVDLGALANKVTGNTEWLSSSPTLHTPMPKGYEAYGFIFFMACFYFFKTAIAGAGMGNDPKYFGARNDRECGLLSFLCGWTMAMRWSLMLAFAVLGLFLVYEIFPDQSVLASAAHSIKQYYSATGHQQWAQLLSEIANHPDACSPALISELKMLFGEQWMSKLSMVGFYGTVDPERIVPAVLLFKVPIGIRGLLLVALLAAAMSTFNSLINMTSAYLVRDFYQAYLRPNAGNREIIYAGYGSGLFIVVAGFLTSCAAQSINDIWGWLMMGLNAGMVVPLALRLYWWRFNGCGFTLGTLAGVAGAIVQRVVYPDTPEWVQFLIATLASVVGCTLGTYITSPTDDKTLTHFYATTRPFGWWKPLQIVLAPDILAKTKREHFYDIVALPFVLGWIISVFLFPMQLIIRQYVTAMWTSAILAVSLTGMYFFWYKQLPREDGLVHEDTKTKIREHESYRTV
jgi:solute:Na+ symporter, SSS family